MPHLVPFILQLDSLIPEISGFIAQFNSLIQDNSLNVITDVQGNLMVDAPGDMSDKDSEFFGKKVGVLDRIINCKLDEADKLIEQGKAMEKEIKNSKESSQVLAKINELKGLKKQYGHFIPRES